MKRRIRWNFFFKSSERISIRTCIILIVGVSLVCSAGVGAALTQNFSGQLRKQTAMVQKIRDISGAVASRPETTQHVVVAQTAGFNGVSPVTEIAKKVGPSIVGIRVTAVNPNAQSFNSSGDQSQTEGSGIIISKDGYIMTNYHVVGDADPRNGAGQNVTLEVFLPDKREAKAKFVGGDALNDIAVIKINLNNLTTAELGDSSQLQVGELAVAIGNPLGMEFMGSVTSGVVSALNRTVNTGDQTLTLIQTDAAINPGNSGGALVNADGRVIGMNTAKIAVSGVEGLGFAIPINTAKPIVSQLIMFGYIKGRPLVGISGQEISDVLARFYRMPVGVYVTDTTPGGGAAKAGIKKGDILIGLDNKPVKTMQDVEDVKKNHRAGDTVSAIVQRDNQKINMKLTFTEDK